ncbi:hypothetical protein [Aquimarina algicola]|uniref:Uncharacterized protein n=1 Tax=Aquimarina algicola TaxID=2589995 RepID=A0A504JMI1_9FLAO|nr:hypothetical protein [Aquimarina algicola]TPN87969.1 hypothetical protein FHK87_10375 [Aquimarina algicola]
MHIGSQPSKNKFIATVLAAFHMTTDQFMYNLVRQSLYETILYLWINKLYTKGKTSDEAIQLIYKARNLFLLDYYKKTCAGYNKV